MSPTEVSRRRFLGTGAAAGAGVVLGGSAEAATAPPARSSRRGRRKADVAIVGAGFAGLTAARRLVEAGRKVIVLEARRRVGGRVQNFRIVGGEISERGGTFVGPTQDHILALAKEMGVDTFPTYDEGNNVYYADGSRSTYSDQSPSGTAPPDPVRIADIAATVTLLDQMSTEVPVDAPWKADKAEEWDSQTLESWIRDHSTNPKFREIVPVATRPIFGAEPRDLSLLFTLFYIAASGNEQNPGTFERNFNTRNGAQMFRFHGGSQLIVDRMAHALGRRVKLGVPVRRIAQSGRGVKVYTKRFTVSAKRAIVAIPPTLAGRIDYRPVLPDTRDQLTQHMPQGTLLKVGVVYDRAFWRDDGLTGQGVSIDGPMNFCVDDSPPSGKPGVLFGFVGADEARKFLSMSLADRQAAIVSQLAIFFGDKAKSPIQYFETNWTASPWTRGCPVAIAGPGVLVGFGAAIREPVGRIHWAGTETSGYWVGYMDGAVRSGERAAKEVLAEL
jgi:monoamine oxidase